VERNDGNRFRELFENMSSGAAIYRPTDDGEDFLVVDFNWAGELIERKRKDDVVGRRLTEAFPEVSGAGLLEVVRRVWRTSSPEYRLITVAGAKGEKEWRENHIFKLPSGEVVNVYNDVTENKKMEETLRQSEETWNSIAKNAAIVIVTVDRSGKIMFLNHAISGKDNSQIVGTKVQDYVSPEYADIVSQRIERVFRTGESDRYEVMGGPQGDNLMWHEVSFAPVELEGKIMAVSLIANDVTQRKRTEEALKTSEEKYRTLIEGSNHLPYAVDMQGIVKYVGPQVNRYGYSEDEVISRSFLEFVVS